ncbi:hypothetical protein [Flavobacterium quisquiliarum]|uniref:Uncharacterized protein n=1 Tax=Flavobacterium quisquiliarum TaxID=1834436 RepID=A0ABV8WBL8_9FLAO|nr:hypothetical protein [Flavobacterium quisquiliarum]MBW1654046.1 hypothetical protein [Flavobacterium quisquiliarum]NWL04193.1 hypothetical protein [Flavobacterium collinsii]
MQIMIYVFKTSVDSQTKFESASLLLDQLLPESKWNFDLEDCDNILRIDSELDIPNLIQNNGIFDCIELE